jgi:hypothetical protein
MGKAKRRKQDPDYGNYFQNEEGEEDGLIIDGIKFVLPTEENIQRALKKYLGFVRFVKLNDVIYALDGNGLVPAKSSTRYSESQELIDGAIEDLSNREDGSYIFLANRQNEGKWFRLPISFGERVSLAEHDASSMNDVSSSTITLPLIPS